MCLNNDLINDRLCQYFLVWCVSELLESLLIETHWPYSQFDSEVVKMSSKFALVNFQVMLMLLIQGLNFGKIMIFQIILCT